MTEKTAVNVTQECADVYYGGFDNLPKTVKTRVSCHMLAEIFRAMVVPAIDHARALDRDGRESNAKLTSPPPTAGTTEK